MNDTYIDPYNPIFGTLQVPDSSTHTPTPYIKQNKLQKAHNIYTGHN
jgi:hypothetical protein